jgi:hypothetical protein
VNRKLRLWGGAVLLVLVGAAILWQSGVLGLVSALSASAASFVVMAFGVGRTRGFLVQLRWALPFMVFLVTVVSVGIFMDREGTPPFYTLAAQVIPVLLLAIGLESTLIAGSKIRDPFELLLAGLTLAYLAIAEFYAFRAVELGRGSEEAFSWVVAALAAGLVAIATLGLLGWSVEEDST